MVEYLIASLEHMQVVSIKFKETFTAGIMVVEINWTGLKAVAITALEIFVILSR